MTFRIACFAALVVLCACEAHTVPNTVAGPVSDLSRNVASRRPHGGVQVTLTFPFPMPSSTPDAAVGYVSPGTKEVYVTANGASVLNALVQPYSTNFSQTFIVPTGNVSFVAKLETLYGTVLSQAQWQQQINASGTTLNAVFQGVVQRGLLKADNPAPPVGTAAVIHVTFAAADPAGFLINTGTYVTPVGVTFKDPTSNMTLQGSVTKFTDPSSTVEVAYNGKPMTSYATISTTGASANQTLSLIGNSYVFYPIKQTVGSIAKGPAGTLLFDNCERSCTIKSIDSNGTIKMIGRAPAVDQMLYASDGAIWFTEGSIGPTRVGKMTLTGSLTQYAMARDSAGGDQIIQGPDGNIWYTDEGGIDKLTADGHSTHYNAPILSEPMTATYLTYGGGRFYYDDSPFAICTTTLGGASTCFGFPDVDDGDRNVEFSAPLLYYKDACFVVTSSVNGSGNPTVSTIDGTGKVQRIASPPNDAIVPQALGHGEGLLGMGGRTESHQTLDIGVTLQTFQSGKLRNVTYPLPPNTNASGSYGTAAKLVVIGNDVWFRGTGGLYRFSYRH